MKNPRGWKKYEKISNKFSKDIHEAIDNIDDPTKLETKLRIIDEEIKLQSFGVIWINPNKKKNKRQKRRDSKDLKQLYDEYLEDLEEAIEDASKRKDINQRMYRLKQTITGPKIKSAEQAAINHPVTGELITDPPEIKKASLEHNVRILRKQPPPEEIKGRLKEKEEKHQEMMSRDEEEDNWELTIEIFDSVTKKIKLKGKRMFDSLNKAGTEYKNAIFRLMKRLIEKEEIPSQYEYTSLSQIWKKKGSALDLNNMRFIHMKFWRAKLLEGLITAKMKDKIVSTTPPMQIGGMPKSQPSEHLYVLKTWIKQIEENDDSGVYCVYDMKKFFDIESLSDCMSCLRDKVGIDAKTYRMWFNLNDKTRISVKTSVGESGTAMIRDSIAQGSFGAALVSSVNIGTAIDEAFKDHTTAEVGEVDLNCLILQDDISNMNSNVDQARISCNIIDSTLREKMLQLNYDKSKFLVFGKPKEKRKILKILDKSPLTMNNVVIGNSEVEKYLGDYIHEKGLQASIDYTIKDRMRKLFTKKEEIIQIANSSVMSGLRNSRTAFNLFESSIIPALLNNCETWIDIQEKHITDLQNFQEKFIRRVLHLPNSAPKVLLAYDTGMWNMSWRIKLKKLKFIQRISQYEDENIAKKVLMQERNMDLNGLVAECIQICEELNIPSVLDIPLSANRLKGIIQNKINMDLQSAMSDSRKVADRLFPTTHDKTYFDKMGLGFSRIFFRIRARLVKGVKGNFKRSWGNDLNCRFCKTGDLESQDHLEVCGGCEWERRGLRMEKDSGLVTFWRRMEKKIAAVT